jgi:hypothetical protein
MPNQHTTGFQNFYGAGRSFNLDHHNMKILDVVMILIGRLTDYSISLKKTEKQGIKI